MHGAKCAIDFFRHSQRKCGAQPDGQRLLDGLELSVEAGRFLGAFRRTKNRSPLSEESFVQTRSRPIFLPVLFALIATGCSSRGGSALPQHGQLPMPASVSPGSIVPPPMAVTAILPPSAMQSAAGGAKTMSAVQGPNFTKVPGAAIFAAGAPDGSLWVLSNLPSGPDKNIWHFANGVWTNISGLANHISVAPDLSLYASNSAGGAYHYSGGSWTALGGGVSDIAAASDSSLYVLSNSQPAGNDQAVWHYTTGWTQIPGAGVRIAASVDVGTHVIPGGIVGPAGIYVVNASGLIYYLQSNGSYIQLSGAAAGLAPSVGGLFVLGYPSSASGTPMYYYDLDNPGWTQPGGSGIALAATPSQLYVISADTSIYTTPLLPAAVPVSYFRQLSALKVTNTLGTSMSSILGVAISEAADQTENGINGTMSLGTLTIGSGTTAQSVQPQSVSTQQQHVAVEGGGEHRAVNDGPDTEFQTQRLRRSLPPASSGPAIRPQTSTIGANPIVGTTANIWVGKSAIGSGSTSYVQVPSTLEFQSAHGNVWIDNSLLSGTNASPSFQGPSLVTTVGQIGADFENAYLSDTTHFASFDYPNNAPGVTLQYEAFDSSGNDLHHSDNQYIFEPTDKRINLEILNTANLGSGVGGYFSSVNYTPQEIWNYYILHGGNTPMSNEAPFIYCGWFETFGATYELQEDLVRGTAHELQHLINFVNHSILPAAANTYAFDGFEDTFINEGLSMLSQDLAVNSLHPTQAFDVADAMAHAQQYLSSPQNYSLSGFIGIDPVSWGGDGSTPKYNCGGGCYGSAYLFQRYMRDRFGGDTYTQGMETSQQTGFANLQVNGGSEPAGALMGDFAIAIATNSQQIAPPNAQFTLGTFNTRTTYSDQFGHNRVLTGVTSAVTLTANGTTSFTPPVGGFGFFGLAANNGSAVSIVDGGTGTFALFGGLAQH
jgi:hypothetical protein